MAVADLLQIFHLSAMFDSSFPQLTHNHDACRDVIV